MVADNYCFAVDGDRIQMNDIFSDDQVSFLFNKQIKANFYMMLLIINRVAHRQEILKKP